MKTLKEKEPRAVAGVREQNLASLLAARSPVQGRVEGAEGMLVEV